MYGNNVGSGGAVLGAGGVILPNTGGPDSLWFWVAIGCILVGLFALFMSTGAFWRMIPAGLRRSVVGDTRESDL